MHKMSYLSWSLEPHKAVLIVCKKTTTHLELELGTKTCLNLHEDTVLGAGAWNQSCLNMPKKTTSLELELATANIKTTSAGAGAWKKKKKGTWL